MTDFFADLEAELLGAADRRAAGVRARTRRRSLSVLLRPVLVLAAVLAALAVAFAVFGEPSPDRAADEVPASLPAPVVTAPCADPDSLRAPVGAPPRRLSDAIDALPGQYERVVAVPQAVVAAVQGLDTRDVWVDAVARVPGGAGVDVYVVPVRRARPCAEARSVSRLAFDGVGACLVAERGGEVLASFCQPVWMIETGGTAFARLRGETLALGFASDGAAVQGFETERGGRGFLRPRGNVIAALVRDTDRAEFAAGMPVVSMARGADDPRPPRRGRPGPVAILNATTTPGLAARFADRLEGLTAYEPGAVENAPTRTLRRSVVRYAAAGARDDAEVVAGALLGDGTRVERVPPADLGARAPVVVLLGRDAPALIDARAALPRHATPGDIRTG